MTFSIEKSKLPITGKHCDTHIDVELYQEDADSEWKVDKKKPFVFWVKGRTDNKPYLYEMRDSEIPIKMRYEIFEYIAANQAEIEKQAQENQEADRSDYEYAKYLEEGGI